MTSPYSSPPKAPPPPTFAQSASPLWILDADSSLSRGLPRKENALCRSPNAPNSSLQNLGAQIMAFSCLGPDSAPNNVIPPHRRSSSGPA